MATLQLWETLKTAIPAYTGLSPATFFTVLALAFAFYYAISGFFSSSPEPRTRALPEEVKPLPPPVQLGEITEEELKAYDGSDETKPLLMAIKGQIYDVTQSRMFYGPGGPYALFAGKDASRALAKMSFEEKDLTGDISGLGPFELDALQDWEYKFMGKYIKVGTIKKTVLVADASSAPTGDSVEAANPEDAKPAENGESETAKPAENAESESAKPTENGESESAIAAENRELESVEPAENGELESAEPAENGELESAEPAENGELESAEPAENGELESAKPAENGHSESGAGEQADKQPAKEATVGGDGDAERE